MENTGDKAPRSPVLTANLPARLALCRIFGEQLSAIERHTPGARLGRDPEALHDLRVAVRRTRSALGQFHKLLPAAEFAHFRSEFRWVGEVTSPVRDLDVYLEHLPEYSRWLNADAAGAFASVRRLLLQRRRAEQRRLRRRLDSKRYRQLLADWRRFLAGSDHEPWPAKAARPTALVARRRTWKLYRDFIRQGEAITGDDSDRALHRLRITGKKLRYLVEFFRPLYPATEIEVLVKAMKRIQDYLGAYQDCAVQREQLKELAGLMAAGEELPEATAAVIASLISSMHQRQSDLRHEFPRRFAVFSRGRVRRGFVRLYAPEERS